MSEEELQASTTVASCIGQPVGTNTDSYLIIGSSIKK